MSSVDFRGHKTDCVFFSSEHCQGADECWCDRGHGTFDPKCKGCKYYINREAALKLIEDMQEAEEIENGRRWGE